jgi:XTP/dITP diphosphohydrolase
VSRSARAGRPTWVVASANPGKVREFAAALGASGVVLRCATEVGIDRFPPETGASYEENALLKAGFAATKTGCVAVADDSGLEVDALGGEPGVRSARFGGELSDGERIAHLLSKLRRVPDDARTARFVSVVVVAHPDGDLRVFRGVCEGRILQGPRGDGGFGYDPVFCSDDLGVSFGEASLTDKGRVSHRGRALAALSAWLASDASERFRDPR